MSYNGGAKIIYVQISSLKKKKKFLGPARYIFGTNYKFFIIKDQSQSLLSLNCPTLTVIVWIARWTGTCHL